jgi:hypothetical protein
VLILNPASQILDYPASTFTCSYSEDFRTNNCRQSTRGIPNILQTNIVFDEYECQYLAPDNSKTFSICQTEIDYTQIAQSENNEVTRNK